MPPQNQSGSPEPTFNIFARTIKAFEDESGQKLISTTASSTVEDLHGDDFTATALQKMAESAMSAGMTIFLNHKYSVPEDVFGSTVTASVVQRGTDEKTGKPIFDLDLTAAVEESNPRALKTYEMIRGKKAGRLGVSIGAVIRDYERKKNGGYTINDVELLEASIVGIPANPRSWVHYAVKTLNAVSECEDCEDEVAIKGDSGDYAKELRSFLAKAALTGFEYVFDGYQAPVEHPVMVGAEHDDVLEAIVRALFPGHDDVSDIAASLVPAADSALLRKPQARSLSEAGRANPDSSLHGLAGDHRQGVPDARAAATAVLRGGPDRGIERVLLTADDAVGDSLQGSMGRMPSLVRELTGIAAELGYTPVVGEPVVGPDLATFLADVLVGDSFHTLSITKSEWTSAYVASLPDSAFACIDSTGRHYPHHSKGGAVDPPHLRAALSRVGDPSNAQCGGKAKAHLEAHAKALGIGEKEAEVGFTLDADGLAHAALDAVADGRFESIEAAAEALAPEFVVTTDQIVDEQPEEAVENSADIHVEELPTESPVSLSDGTTDLRSLDGDALERVVDPLLKALTDEVRTLRAQVTAKDSELRAVKDENAEMGASLRSAIEIVERIARTPLGAKTAFARPISDFRTKFGSVYDEEFIELLERDTNGH